MPPEALPTIEELAAKMTAAPSETPVEETVKVTDAKPGSAIGETVEEPVKTAEEVIDEAAIEEVKAVVEAPKRDPQAARFAALARREKEARQFKMEAETRAKEIELREKAISDREAKLSVAKKHPLELLKEHGYSYADATQAMLGNYKPVEPDPVVTKLDEKLNPVAEQVQQLKAAQDQINATLREIQQHRVEIAQREVRQAIESAAKEGGHEFVSAIGDEAYSLVQDVLSEYYKKHKRILNYEEACGRVEKYYSERYEKLNAAPKVQSRLASTTTKTTPSKPTTVKPAKESKTLTQSLSTSARAKTDIDSLSRNDALAELATRLRYIPD